MTARRQPAIRYPKRDTSATLRTLGAIHLASALSVRDEVTAFCCYDRRLLDAAGDAGLPVHAPGT